MVKTVLVTGGAGYIGSVFCKKLVENGYNVKIIDRFLFGNKGIKDIVDKIKVYEFDIRKLDGDMVYSASGREILDEIFKDVDIIFHLAAIANDPMGLLNPEATNSTNVEGTRLLADVAKMYGIKRFVYASSASVYGFNESIVDENSELNPQSVYASSKINAEKLLLSRKENGVFEPIILRQGTVSGASPRMRYDLIINSMVKSVIQEHRVVIFGDENTSRPIIGLDDLTNAYLTIIKQYDTIESGVYNISGMNNTVVEVAKAIAQEYRVPVYYGMSKSDPRSYKMSCGKIMQALPELKFGSHLDIAREVYNKFPEPDATTQSIDWITKLQYIYPHIKHWDNGVL